VKGKVQVIPWFGATEAGMKNETERNRYILFGLSSRIDKPRFTLPSSEMVDTMRSKSLAILMRCWVRAKELHAYLTTKCQVSGLYSRYTESHSLPVSMWAAIVGLNNDEAENLFNEVIGPMLRTLSFISESEHGSLINDILFARVDLGRGEKKMVNELLTNANHEVEGRDGAEKILARVGIRKMLGSEFKKGSPYSPEERVLFIAHRIVQRELLRGTDFQDKGLDQLLERIPRSYRTSQRLGGSPSRGIAIPMESAIPFESQLKVKEEQMESEGFVPPEHRSISEDIFGKDGV
jgi:hypothetical protein